MWKRTCVLCSVTESCLTLRCHALQHARLLCPPLFPGVCSNSCPLNWWCCLTISSSAAPFSFGFSLFQHQVFSSELTLSIKWPKLWSFSFCISLSSEYSGLISFRIDWFDLAVQGTVKSLFQHHSSKASVLQCSAFFMVQLSHPYMTTGKTMALTRWTFVGKVMFLHFNMLSRLIKAFLLRSKCLLISRLQSPSTVILEPKKIKPLTVSIVSSSICHEMTGLYAMIFVFWMLNFQPAFSLSSVTFIKRLFNYSNTVWKAALKEVTFSHC